MAQSYPWPGNDLTKILRSLSAAAKLAHLAEASQKRANAKTRQAIVRKTQSDGLIARSWFEMWSKGMKGGENLWS